MRLLSRAAIGLAATLIAAPLSAQTSFSLAAGATVPVGSTADGYDIGYNVTAAIGIKPPLAPLGLRIDGMWNEIEGKGNANGKLRLLAGSANVTLSGAGPVPMGYLIAGVGAYNAKFVDRAITIGGNTSNTEFGLNVGGGINFPLTGFSTFLEARFHFLTDSEIKIIPITFGLRF
jgi:hypothetical protein